MSASIGHPDGLETRFRLPHSGGRELESNTFFPSDQTAEGFAVSASSLIRIGYNVDQEGIT